MNLHRDRSRLLAELRREGIRDQRVLASIGQVSRETFISPRLFSQSYSNRALPIDCGQTISQPYIVALMTEALEPRATDRVLEIGTGCGYQTAVLSELVSEIFTVERFAELSHQAEDRLKHHGIHNVHCRVGDGTRGWPEHAPFDGIIVTATSPTVPTALVEQLAEGGRLVIPVGPGKDQMLMLLRKVGGKIESTPLCACRFVRLVGHEGWPSEHGPEVAAAEEGPSEVSNVSNGPSAAASQGGQRPGPSGGEQGTV